MLRRVDISALQKVYLQELDKKYFDKSEEIIKSKIDLLIDISLKNLQDGEIVLEKYRENVYIGVERDLDVIFIMGYVENLDNNLLDSFSITFGVTTLHIDHNSGIMVIGVSDAGYFIECLNRLIKKINSLQHKKEMEK